MLGTLVPLPAAANNCDGGADDASARLHALTSCERTLLSLDRD
jgi:hypothetical protein